MPKQKLKDLEERIWNLNREVADLLKGEIPTPWLPGCPSVTIRRDYVWDVARYPTKGPSATEIIMRDAVGNYSSTPIEKFKEEHRQGIQLIKNQRIFWEIQPLLDELERLRKEREALRARRVAATVDKKRPGIKPNPKVQNWNLKVRELKLNEKSDEVIEALLVDWDRDGLYLDDPWLLKCRVWRKSKPSWKLAWGFPTTRKKLKKRIKRAFDTVSEIPHPKPISAGH